MRSFLLLVSAVVAAGALAAACSNDDSSGDTVNPDGGSDTQAIAAGLVVEQIGDCTSCHGSDYSGNIKEPNGNYSSNITPDQATGIGSWTLTDLTNALRESIDDQGQQLCSPMPKFSSFTDQQISDLYAFLRSIPAVSKAQTETDCAGNPVTN